MKRLIVLIYGLKGSDSRFGEYFPNLLKSDPQLSELYKVVSCHCHFGFFRYLFSNKELVIETLTRRLRKKLLRANKNYTQVAFVCHGLGGLVARQYIMEEAMNQKTLDVDRISMFAVPNSKLDLARIYDSLSWKDFFGKNISRHPETIEKLNKAWAVNALEKKVAVKYVLGDLDNIIDKSDALAQWGTGYFTHAAKKDHWSVFKPESHDDSAFLITKRFLLSEAHAQKKYPKNLLAIAEVLSWELDSSELESARNDIINLVDSLNQLQWRSRQLLCALIQKANQISYDEMVVTPSEISKTMNLTTQELEAELSFLKKYELIDFTEGNESEKIKLRWPDEKWLIWDQLKGYCQKTGIGLKRLIVDLQFDLLDSKKMAS
ncbi:MAG: hypothetical protein JRJ27_14455 [Deltaproteobacteria bacterium]|nr:hypothetical protein [Deltaproteobacteria bacterium]